jgi:NAD(P)H-quinone oxidoreductase subunit 5
MPSLWSHGAWPAWWSAVLALAWAPLLWLPHAAGRPWHHVASQAGVGVALVAALSALAGLAHAVPFGVVDAPNHAAGIVALAGMAALYVCLALLQWRPRALSAWRRWSYAGFYVDEFYTRLALRWWPDGWAPSSPHTARIGTEPLVAPQ